MYQTTCRGYTTHISKPTLMYCMTFMFYEYLVKLLLFRECVPFKACCQADKM